FSNTGLDVQASGCAVDQTLPLGLTLAVYADDGTMTCRITGTPSAVTARQVYTLTATSTGGGTATATVSIDVRLKVLKSATQVSAGNDHTCAISGDGEIFCWGLNNGRLGLGMVISDLNTPHLVGDATNWSQISVGNSHTCAINTDSKLYCWGAGATGQLGIGDTDSRTVPTRVGDAVNWMHVSSGREHTCAINSAGHLFCWGESDNGRLGIGDEAMDSLAPARVGEANNWSQVSAGGFHTCATRSDGQLYCWGEGDTGRLGLGIDTTIVRNAPTRVGDSANWMQVSTFLDRLFSHTCAINSASRLYCWGSNLGGKLGLGDSDDRNTPTLVGEASNWSQIGRSFFHTCATRSDGQLYCWGSGASVGRLGLGELNGSNVPARVGDAANWSQVSTGEEHTCAINSDNRLYCWGEGLNGRLGLGDTTDRTTPVAVTPAP
ncbi:MAG: putative Ig domain-containing protein, partial [Proteobacteria bacterium]|nr:putative Ig domain-containing protein [Pseudomonadota bacterium]